MKTRKAQLSRATIRSILFFGFIGIITIVSHFLLRPSYLTPFILFFLIERVYESYFTVKKSADSNLTQDRHLNHIIAAFCIMVLAAVSEFYFIRRPIIPAWTMFGFLLLMMSGYLRWLSIKTVGNDWAIDTFAIPTMIQRHGPYRYLRHPYYLGVFLEAASFPIILNSWYTLLFSICVVAPLEGYRAILEEKVLIKNYGWDYIRFKREVSHFLPTFAKKTVYERRRGITATSDERRNRRERRSQEEQPPNNVDRRKIIRN